MTPARPETTPDAAPHAAPGSPREARRDIRSLPPLLVNQIAAGEVIERPASVVKELVENALDARATRLEVALESGGIELVRVSDNGTGIPPDQLHLAIAPHATSKIARAEDLDRIGTLGFRGEALASIASVARVSIRSRTPDRDAAASIDVEGGEASPIRPDAGPPGTTITVRNLFFNTPARRKFLRTPTTEQTRAIDVVRDLAMAHPNVAFRALCDGRVVLDLPPDQSPRERGLGVLGRELDAQLLEVHADRFDDSRGVALWGLIGLPSIARATAQAQHVFLNGRVIRDKTIQHAIREAYRGLIEPGRYPTALIMIEMDPGAVDVNVHPAKVEVRFRDSGVVHSIVLRSLREALQRADLTPTFDTLPAAARVVDGARAIQPQVNPDRVSAFIDSFRTPPPSSSQPPITYATMRETLATDAAIAPPSVAASVPPIAPPAAHTPPGSLPQAIALPRVLQVHNSYLVTQDEQGVVIVDQHALHERVMFEQLVARVRAGPLERQRLLMPSIVPAAPAQIEGVARLAPLLERLGVECEPLGPASLGVHAFPTFLFDRGVDPVEFMGDLIERAESEGFEPGSEQALHEVLDMMACKAAVKAGDRMSTSELDELMRLRGEVERSSNCPHGRPTTVRLTIRQLERLFGRS
jgi:DNA mismatch repair protein MutL